MNEREQKSVTPAVPDRKTKTKAFERQESADQQELEQQLLKGLEKYRQKERQKKLEKKRQKELERQRQLLTEISQLIALGKAAGINQLAAPATAARISQFIVRGRAIVEKASSVLPTEGPMFFKATEVENSASTEGNNPISNQVVLPI